MIQQQRRRTITAIMKTKFCVHCHLVLHRKGDINEITGYPERNFWHVDGANNIVCTRCNNKVKI